MTLQDAIKGMMNLYKAVEKVYFDLPKGVKVANKVKEQLDDCLIEASDAAKELEKMQTVGVNCEHCKFNGSCANACGACMFLRLSPYNQKKHLNYEPI